MKQILIALILLTSFLTASAAELACACSEEAITYSQDCHDNQSADSNEQHKDHCQHSCSQCHFAALVPRYFNFNSESIVVRITFFTTHEISQEVTESLYRPPIA